MTEVQFDEPGFAAPPTAKRKERGLSQLIIEWGLARDEKGASHVLLSIAALAAIVALVVASLFLFPPQHPAVPL